MDIQERKLKFPIGAIFMLIYVALYLINTLSTLKYAYNSGSFYVMMILRILACVGLAVVLIRKNKGIPVIVLAGVMLILSFNAGSLVNINTLLANTFVSLGWVCIILLSLEDININNLVKYKRLISIILIVLTAICLLMSIINLFSIRDTHNVRLIYVLKNLFSSVFYYGAILFTGLWVYNPYAKIREGGNDKSDCSGDYFYTSLGKHICLLLFTFGIWQMIWVCRATAYTNSAKGEEERNPVSKLLLYIFVPFYSIYWTYKTAQRIDKIAKEKGVQSDLGTVCLILSIFISFVPPILMQDKINGIIEAKGEVGNNEMDYAMAIEKYKELLDNGIITEDEFNSKKKQILGL